MSEEKKKQIKEIIDWLLSHNKNYTNAQYYQLLDLEMLLQDEVRTEGVNE